MNATNDLPLTDLTFEELEALGNRVTLALLKASKGSAKYIFLSSRLDQIEAAMMALCS